MTDTTLAYVDDSGDQRAAVLCAVLVPASQWLDVHDALVRFRRRLSRDTGFRMGYELKATELVGAGGRWRRLQVPMRTRIGIYRAAMRELASMAPVVRTFAVVLPDRADQRLDRRHAEVLWRVTLERLQTYSVKTATTCILVPDEGNPRTVTKLARRHRRFAYVPAAFGPGGPGTGLPVPFERLVDDPFHKNSASSYLMQWTDLAAYAAFRAIVPTPGFPPTMWETLDDARLGEANAIERRKGSREQPGLIVWPSRMRPGVPL